jgi:crotonobetainyl-CoA:carnitine CoA-transferase CaiB-like acyl-CoA transferase
MLEAIMAACPEPAVDTLWRQKHGNAYPGAALHGCFRAAGEDEWVVVACDTPEDVAQLCATLELSVDAGDANATRKALADIALRHTPAELAAKLRAGGVAAAPVRRHVELLADERYRESGFFVSVDHPAAGRRWYPEVPVRFRRDAVAAPVLGEHNELVWRELVGVGRDEYDELVENGVIG